MATVQMETEQTANKQTAAPAFTIDLVHSTDTEDVMSFLRRSFFIDEPLNEAVQLCYPDGTCAELEDYCTSALTNGFSYKAVDKDGNIIGVMINEVRRLDNSTLPEYEIREKAKNCKNPKFQKILYILAEREKGAQLWTKHSSEEYMVEVKLAATDRTWRQRGIMTALIKKTEAGTKSRGIKLLRMDTSSVYSAMAAERLGFICVYNALYTNITKDGKFIIVPKHPHLYDQILSVRAKFTGPCNVRLLPESLTTPPL